MNRNELLALVQAENGWTFPAVRFVSPLDASNGSIDWVGRYEPRGKEYHYKCAPEIELKSGDLVVVAAQNSVAVAEVQSVGFAPSPDWDTSRQMRRIIQKVDRSVIMEVEQSERDMLDKMARAEASAKLAEIRKTMDLSFVENVVCIGETTEDGEVIE